MYDANRSLKTKIEAGFSVKGSELLLVIPLDKTWGAQLLSCWDEYWSTKM